jgi:subtilisin family serine protease
MPGKMILKIKGPALDSAVGTLRGGGARLAARVKQDLPESVTSPLDYLKANAGLKHATPLFVEDSRHRLTGLNAARTAAIVSVADSPHEDLQGYTVVTVDPKKVTPKVIKHVSASSAVQFVEPMPARWIASPAKSNTIDPKQQEQWGLQAMGWFGAKRPTALQAGRVKVAVLDTGIDQTHPDLKGVVASYDHKSNGATDVVGHGTHVAGIIAAVTNNGIGISGLAACQLAVWKIFDDDPINGDFYVNGELYLRALGLLPDTGSTIVNLSIGGTEQSRAEALLFRRLRERNIIPIAAMGNEYEEGNPVEFPAAYPGVIAVGAISELLRRASFSNTGKHISIVAPGHTILSTVPVRASRYRRETEYATWSGTSMATPHVAGAAALYCAKKPHATANQLANALQSTAKKLAQMKKRKFTTALGYGLVYLPKLL